MLSLQFINIYMLFMKLFYSEKVWKIKVVKNVRKTCKEKRKNVFLHLCQRPC